VHRTRQAVRQQVRCSSHTSTPAACLLALLQQPLEQVVQPELNTTAAAVSTGGTAAAAASLVPTWYAAHTCTHIAYLRHTRLLLLRPLQAPSLSSRPVSHCCSMPQPGSNPANRFRCVVEFCSTDSHYQHGFHQSVHAQLPCARARHVGCES
jgi:hypothetical protein